MGRVQAAVKNIAFGQIGNFITQILNFVLRTMFIHHLGDTLNGVNGLYTNMLSVLSMAELGIGTALNYSLYKPVARGDVEKVKSYMQLYKKAYRIIGIVIAVLGLACAPFLPYLIKSAEGIAVRDLTLYYFIFLFNTVSTYFVSYKYSLINAEQKNYIQTNIITITKMITVLLQMIVIVTTGNFYAYLLTAAGVELLQKIFVSYYLNHRYPYLKEKEVKKLSKEETGEIVTKTKALMLHKIGDVARLQTDSMIISGFISTTISGFVDNYNMVLNSVANVVNIIFNSVLSSFGNLFATESRQKQYQIFKVYRFAACWIYGFSAMGFSMLLTPLIQLWLGEERTLAFSVVICILIDYYFKGDRIVLSNFKTAAGVFEQDKYLSIIQGAVNLVISIVGAKYIGLAGVYIGTVVSGVMANLVRPIIIYRDCFARSAWDYFKDSLKYICTILGILLVLLPVKKFLLAQVNILTFLLTAGIVTIVYNLVFICFFRKTEEFGYLLSVVCRKFRKKA